MTTKERIENIKRKVRKHAINLAVGATVVTSFSPTAANAQSRGDSNQGNRYEYVQQPDGSFKMVEVTNNRPAAPQQRRSRNTPGTQSAQEIFRLKQLPPLKLKL